MKHFLKLCTILFVALFFIACKNAAGPSVPSIDSGGHENELEITPDTPNTEDETGSGSSDDSTENGTDGSGGSTGGSTGDTDSGDTGTGGTNEGGTGSGGATDGTGSGGTNEGGTGSAGSTDGTGSDGTTDESSGSGTTDGGGSTGSSSENEDENPDKNENVITDNALNFMTDGDITFILTGATFSGTWTIENGVFNSTDATMTIGENITFEHIRSMFETAIQFENTTVTMSYEDSTITHVVGREYENLVILISITPNEGYSFTDGTESKIIKMQFDLKK